MVVRAAGKVIYQCEQKNAAHNASSCIHVIASGDSLSKIAKIYGINLPQLIEQNPHLSQNSIFPGERVFVSHDQFTSPTNDPELARLIFEPTRARHQKMLFKNARAKVDPAIIKDILRNEENPGPKNDVHVGDQVIVSQFVCQTARTKPQNSEAPPKELAHFEEVRGTVISTDLSGRVQVKLDRDITYSFHTTYKGNINAGEGNVPEVCSEAWVSVEQVKVLIASGLRLMSTTTFSCSAAIDE